MKQKDLLFLLISSAFLAAVWIVFTILHNSLTSTISATLNQQIIPITNSFDGKTLQILQKRTQITPQVILQQPVTPTPTPQLAPVEVISPTTQPTGTQTATNSASKGVSPTP